MSRHRTHPLYVVRHRQDVGCGHQHSTTRQAKNCARSWLRQHPMQRTARIVQIKYNAMRELVTERTVDSVEQSRCTECGERVLTDKHFQIGHKDDCPMIGGGD